VLPPEEWRVWNNVPPVYCRPEDEGWAGLHVVLAKSATEAGIITIDDDDGDGDGVHWSAY
jgi:hypothetical protein